jgi:DNA-binding beta-propeller fold protein YncE
MKNPPSVSRRVFLKSAAAAAGLAAAPFIRTQDKAGTRRPIVGTGAHTYECIHDWGSLPAGLVYGVTHGVAQDAEGLVYIKQRPHETSSVGDAVIVYDPSGRHVRSWGSRYRKGAHGLHLARENGVEYFYLCDTALRSVIKTTLLGEVVWERGCPFESGLYQTVEQYKPANIATAPDGTVYVSDGYGSSFVHIYQSDGTYLSSFGGLGSVLGKLNSPHGIAVDLRGAEPRLVVADRSNSRLQYFSLSGVALSTVAGEVREPCHFDQRQGVLLIPDLKSRVTLLDRDDQLIVHLGDGGDYQRIRDKPRTAFTPGKFVAPHSAIFDRDGNIFVVEWVDVGRVTKLVRLT